MSFLLFFTFLLQADAGVPLMVLPAPAGDAEVVQNLELLELLEETSDLELLEELSAER